MPSDVKFDEGYSLSPKLEYDHYKFTGYTNSFIKFNYTGRGEWYIGMYGPYGDQSTYAFIDKGQDYPMGTHMWEIVSPSSTRWFQMNLNACKESEYNCADGACIPIESRKVSLHAIMPDSFLLVERANYKRNHELADVMDIMTALMSWMSGCVIKFVFPTHI